MDLQCPVCSSVVERSIPNSPYHECPECRLWFQSPLPPKVYEGPHEKDDTGASMGDKMCDRDKEINDNIAKWLFEAYMPKDRSQLKALDVGSKYPYLSYCLRKRGMDAWGMEAIEEAPNYSNELNVPMLFGDFEQIPLSTIVDKTNDNKFHLITLVHMFEHLYDPLEGLRKIRKLIHPDGVLYLRLPDHDISGYEKDLTAGHYKIHPYFHCLNSLMELLVKGEDLFTIVWTNAAEGSGQRDLILKPITKRPRIWAGMIVKNEERDLPRCLKSIEPLVDAVVLVDTGSTDKTLEVAVNTISKPVYTSTYLEASKKDDEGNWKLWNFAKARNQFVQKIEAAAKEPNGPNYLFWIDADDELIHPEKLRRCVYLDFYSIFGIQVDAGGPLWVHHRMWKTGLGIDFEGACHEYPRLGTFPGVNLSDVVVKHDATPGVGESSNQRNLRILEEEFKERPTSTRTAFYLANTHNDGGRKAEAITWYKKRIELGEGYKDEMLFAYLYKARCERALSKNEDAIVTLIEGLSKDNRWAELWMELAYISYDQKRWWECIGYSLIAACQPNTGTQLWRENNKYTDQPLRMISWCYEHLNQQGDALIWALKAKAQIQGHDTDWDNRISRLQSDDKINKIVLNRPGAIGDIIMTLNMIPALREQNPGAEIIYHCAESIGKQLGHMMKMAGVTSVKSSGDIIEQAPGTKVINLIGYPLNDGYPEKPMKKHLLKYFANEMGLNDENMYSLLLPLPEPVVRGKSYVTFHMTAGWSHYKQWSYDRWKELLQSFPDIRFVQIGGADDPKIDLPNVDTSYMGKPLEFAVSLLAHARMHIGVDSFTNHLTNFVWLFPDGTKRRTPAVILWGSTQATAAGYEHNVNISKNLACQPCFRENPRISQMHRGPCINPPGQVYDNPMHQCMEQITVAEVRSAVEKVLALNVVSD